LGDDPKSQGHFTSERPKIPFDGPYDFAQGRLRQAFLDTAPTRDDRARGLSAKWREKTNEALIHVVLNYLCGWSFSEHVSDRAVNSHNMVLKFLFILD
jgi:hypothetical protein